ncbi:hypothetical protein KJ059_01550 [Myxococcota bacterium]|nr:hypothetical protein [Myxococcota bacterium]MCZ7618345.1 hypothetical protein [Myxococcota bacterium]
MSEELRAAIAPFYLHIKFVHVLAAAIWSFSTSVAWAWYLKPILRSARRHPEDASRRARRDDFMDRFDRGASLEHYAFVLLVLTAGLMLWVLQVDLARWSFLTAKAWIGVLIILPMEAFDIYLSHLGGNKARVRASDTAERLEQAMDWHWRFLRITEPIVMILVPTMFFLAITKPF